MSTNTKRKPIILKPGGGRSYPMGRISSTFKADNDEANGKYSVSEWWLEPNTKGPGAHDHEEDHVFYVLDGTMSIFVEKQWHDCAKGSCIIIPGGTSHDFENRGANSAGILSFNNKAGFENHMPAIEEWFAENPPGDSQ